MIKKISVVAGDLGDARAVFPVARLLQEQGHEVNVTIDDWGEAKGALSMLSALNSRGQYLPYQSVDARNVVSVLDKEHTDLVYVATSSSASGVESAIARAALKAGVPVLFATAGYFNHAFPVWREEYPGAYWSAIDANHAAAIKALRPTVPDDHIIVTGMAAFDHLADLSKDRERIREATRAKLGIMPVEDKKVIVWWSHGTLDVAYEDVVMVLTGLRYLDDDIEGDPLPDIYNFVPRFHPKLDTTVAAGTIEGFKDLVQSVCIHVGLEDGDNIMPEKLTLAADVVLTATSIEGFKSVLMGGPPVVHLLGPQNQKWLEKDLHTTRPFIPHLVSDQALVAWSAQEVGPMILEALKPETRERLKHGWSPPSGGAAKRIAEKILELAK